MKEEKAQHESENLSELTNQRTESMRDEEPELEFSREKSID